MRECEESIRGKNDLITKLTNSFAKMYVIIIWFGVVRMHTTTHKYIHANIHTHTYINANTHTYTHIG